MSETEIFASRTVPSRRWVKDPDSLSLPSSGVGRNRHRGRRGFVEGGRTGVRDERAGSSVVSCR